MHVGVGLRPPAVTVFVLLTGNERMSHMSATDDEAPCQLSQTVLDTLLMFVLYSTGDITIILHIVDILLLLFYVMHYFSFPYTVKNGG